MEKKTENHMSRRSFIKNSGLAIAGSMIAAKASGMLNATPLGKKRVALVGTGIRGITCWGKTIVQKYSDQVEYVALCDINPGRVAYAKEFMGVNCPTYTDLDKMLNEVPIDLLLVCTMDCTHDEQIIKALKKNIDVVTEKPMTTDEFKCQNILNAERQSGKKVIMGFNYRYGGLFTKIKEQLNNHVVGELTSIDFNWYLNVHHGASYFRRWHGLREKGGTLLLHKSSHHFDLLNWWINSEPVEVHAYGALDHYGKNGSIRGKNCRECAHKTSCAFYWDIAEDSKMVKLYAENEKFDGYIRDNCLFREEINIFDKMAVQIKYANGVQVSYSLTTYSPFEGFRLAFNGKDGRMETWEGIPWLDKEQQDQAEIHKKEMDQSHTNDKSNQFYEIDIMKNFKPYEKIELPYIREGHWGGDKVMHERIFAGKATDPALHHAAGTREGAMAVLIGIAARKSILENRIVKISELTDLVPMVKRWE